MFRRSFYCIKTLIVLALNIGPLVLICMLIQQDAESFNYGKIIFNETKLWSMGVIQDILPITNSTSTPNAPPRNKFEDWDLDYTDNEEDELYDLEESDRVEDDDKQ